MAITLDDIQSITDSSDANVSPLIRVELNGNLFNLSDTKWITDEEGDLIFKLEVLK